MQALLKDKEKEKSEPRTRQRSVMLPEMSEDLKARAEEHQQSLTSPASNKSPDDPLAGTIALSTSNMSSDGGADIVPPGSKEGPLQEAPAPAPVPAQDVVAVNETEASEAWRRARKSVDGAAHRESADGVFVERFVFADQEDQDAKGPDDEGNEERCGTSKPFNRATRTSTGSRMRASTSTTDARGDKIARCGDDQCLLLTCPQCDYAVCSAHARAPTYRRVLNDLWMLGRAYILHGWVWFAEFIVLNVAISIYMPVLRTCVMIIGCHPQFQCVFPHCWRKVEQDYAAAVYLAAVVGVVFGIGFPFTLYFLIKGRISVLLDVFGSVSYGGAFMAPFDKITPVVKSDEAEFEFAADGDAGNATVRRQSSSVGAAPAVFSSGIDFHLPNVEETVSNDPMDVSGRSGVTPSSTPRSAAAAGKYLTGPPQPPQAVGLTVSVSDPMELSRSRSSHGQSQSQNHSRSSFLSQQQLSSPGQQALPSQQSQQSQRRSRTRSIMSRHEAETAALELYTAGMPDCLRREIRKTGGIHGDHYDRSAAHWARDFVVRPKLAWAMWRRSKSASKHEAKSGGQRHMTSHRDKQHGSALADNMSDLGGSSELTPMSMSRRRSTRRGSMAESKYLSPEPKAISPSGDQLVAFVDAKDPPSRGESGELKRSRRSISVVVESVGTTPNRRSSLSIPGPLVFPQRIPSRLGHADDDDEDEDLFVGRQDPGVEAHGGDLSSVEDAHHADHADPDGDVRPEEQEETGGQDEEAEDAAEDQDELEDTETPFSLDFPAQTDAQAGTTEGADESRTAAEEDYSDPSGHPDSAQPETYVEAQSMELFDGKDHVVGAASGVINVDLLHGPSFFDDDEETFQAIDDVCAAAIAAAEAEPLDVEDERCTVDDNTPRATPTASATASTPRTLLSPLMSPGRAKKKVPPKSFEALRSKIDTKAKAPLRAPPKKAPTPGSPRRVASPLGAKGKPKPKPKAKAPAKSPAGKAGSPRAPAPKASKAAKGPFAAESWALTPRATAKSAAWRGARGRAASPRRGAPERSSRSPPARQVDFSPIDVDLVEAEEAQTVNKSTLRPRRMTTILAPDTDTESDHGRGGGEALDRAPPSPAFGAAALPRPEDIPAPESPTAKPEPLSFSRSHRRSTFRGSVLLGGSHMARSRRSSHHSHSGLDHHHDHHDDHHDHVHGDDNDDEVLDQHDDEEEDCAARAPPDSIVGDVISLSLAERSQLRIRRAEAEFPTRWLEVLHGIENIDTRRDMAARRIQEFWRRDRPVLALQRVIIETVLEYKAAIVLQRLYKSMLQRKLIAAIKRQAAMAKSHVVLTGEWLRFAKCDASILALVYQQLHFDRITTVPALLCGKFLFVIPTLLLEPQSVGQFVAVCFGEMIYAALFAAFDPYLSPWVTVITLLGSVQQLLLIAAQICVVAVRNDIDISQLTGYAMAGLTLCYFSSIVALLAYMIIQPAMRSNRVEGAVTNLFERFGLLRPQAEETYRYKYPQGYKDIPGLEVDYRQQSHHWAIVPPKAAEDSAVDGIEITTGDEGPVKEEPPVDFSLGEEGAP